MLLGSTAATSLEVWFQDEARVGQKGSLSYVWVPFGSRLAMVRDNRHANAYIVGAICLARGVDAALILPTVNAECKSPHLTEIGAQVAPGAVAALICDGAGWHQTGGALELPQTSSSCRCHPTRQNSTLWRMSGNFCAPTNSAPPSGTATTTSSTPARKPGTGSSTTLNESNPSEPEIGRRSSSSAVGIRPNIASDFANPTDADFWPLGSTGLFPLLLKSDSV